jgi:hypothetical protein
MKQRVCLTWALVTGAVLCLCGCVPKKGASQVASADPSSSVSSSSSPSSNSSGSVPDRQKPRRGVGVFAVRERARVQSKFENLGLAFDSYQATVGRYPTKPEELRDGGFIDKETCEWIKEGYIVVYFNANLDKVPNRATAILAYENAESPGGVFVVTASGAVSRKSNPEIDGAPKAADQPYK